jgi:hypothetical protein
MPMPLPVRMKNSHSNGGRIFLIFVADPTIVRLYAVDTTPTFTRWAEDRPPLKQSGGRDAASDDQLVNSA